MFIATNISKAFQNHGSLSECFQPYALLFTTRAIDEAAHRGYQRWHRELDKEVVEWLKSNQEATQEQFESWLRMRYRQPDQLERFPDGF